MKFCEYMKSDWFVALEREVNASNKTRVAEKMNVNRSTLSAVMNGIGEYGKGTASTVNFEREFRRAFEQLPCPYNGSNVGTTYCREHALSAAPTQNPLLMMHWHPLCPFVQRAAIVLLERGVEFDRINVDLSAKPDWFLALSPTGKVPVLKVRQHNADDAILFESVVICEYLNETQGGAPMYPVDALLRARHRAWIEFATQTFADGWQFLHARDSATADAKRAAFRERLGKLESAMDKGPFFAGEDFGMVDAVYAPLFRYFGIIDATVAHHIFDGFPRISAWRAALEARASVRDAVVEDYADLFLTHLRQQEALIAVT